MACYWLCTVLPTAQGGTTSCMPLTSVVNISHEDCLLFPLLSVVVMEMPDLLVLE